MGFDTLAAQAVLAIKSEAPEVRLILILPCLSQTRGWMERDRQVYEDIKTRADKVVYIAQEYTRDCMFKRNRHLVEYSGVCVCYLTRAGGGTAYTVNYAKRRGLLVFVGLVGMACPIAMGRELWYPSLTSKRRDEEKL